MPLPRPPRTMFVPSEATATTPFGGERNPDNIIYVFDAAYCSANRLLGVALSDGSLRLVNGRGVCLSVLTLPGVQSHLTSFAWDDSGHRLATCVASGHLISWTISPESSTDAATGGSCSRHGGYFVATCTAIMEGGTFLSYEGICHCYSRHAVFCDWLTLVLAFVSRTSTGTTPVWLLLRGKKQQRGKRFTHIVGS